MSLFKYFSRGSLSIKKIKPSDINELKKKLANKKICNPKNININETYLIDKVKVFLYKNNTIVINAKSEQILEPLLKIIDVNFFLKNINNSKIFQKEDNKFSNDSKKKNDENNIKSNITKLKDDLILNFDENEQLGFECTSAGSDESGKGDWFGGITISVCYIDQKIIQKFKEEKIFNKIKDSKKIQDKDIVKLAPKIMNLLGKNNYSNYEIDAEKYNNINAKLKNTNHILVLCHILAWEELLKNNKKIKNKIIDQFVSKENYLKAIDDIEKINNKIWKSKTNIINNIPNIFETGAEDKFFSVSCASILARNQFLEQKEKMENKYEIKFSLGSNYSGKNSVYVPIQKLIKKFGKQKTKSILHKICKIDFITTEKVYEEFGLN